MVDNELRAEAVYQQLEDIEATVFYEKQLTSSDVSASGRVVIPKAIAEQYFPPIDSTAGRELDVQNASGDTYTLRFRFWANNQSRMYLLEGTAELQHFYHLRMGDVLMFAQKRDGNIVLVGRPATKADALKRTPLKRGPPPPTTTSSRPLPAGRQGGGVQQPRPTKEKKKKAMARYGMGGEDVEPPVDGVFRAVPSEEASDAPHSVSLVREGRWVASLNLAGELYQAFFTEELDAKEALNAAGFEAAAAPAGQQS